MRAGSVCGECLGLRGFLARSGSSGVRLGGVRIIGAHIRLDQQLPPVVLCVRRMQVQRAHAERLRVRRDAPIDGGGARAPVRSVAECRGSQSGARRSGRGWWQGRCCGWRSHERQLGERQQPLRARRHEGVTKRLRHVPATERVLVGLMLVALYARLPECGACCGLLFALARGGDPRGCEDLRSH